jgi:hypothetical protein
MLSKHHQKKTASAAYKHVEYVLDFLLSSGKTRSTWTGTLPFATLAVDPKATQSWYSAVCQ